MLAYCGKAVTDQRGAIARQLALRSPHPRRFGCLVPGIFAAVDCANGGLGGQAGRTWLLMGAHNVDGRAGGFGFFGLESWECQMCGKADGRDTKRHSVCQWRSANHFLRGVWSADGPRQPGELLHLADKPGRGRVKRESNFLAAELPHPRATSWLWWRRTPAMGATRSR
jgi:hypothetical protein